MSQPKKSLKFYTVLNCQTSDIVSSGKGLTQLVIVETQILGFRPRNEPPRRLHSSTLVLNEPNFN